MAYIEKKKEKEKKSEVLLQSIFNLPSSCTDQIKS
jgi:hypothetical protein